VPPGEWSGTLPGERLEKGAHQVTVRAVDADGLVGEQSLSFPVDPTGRYNAVPGVRPVVTATKFC
jgi:hypothetical protein